MPARSIVRTSRILHGTARRSTYSRGFVSQSTTAVASVITTARPSISPPRSVSQQASSFATSSSSTITTRRIMGSQNDKTMEDLEKHFTPELFQSLRDFWYEHFESEDDYVMPKPSHHKRWFMGGKELDDICMERFAPTLEAIRESGVTTGDEILKAAKPRGPLDWLSLILLLDQVTRNCYRKEQSTIVFNLFDPMAEQIAVKAIDQGMVDQDPEIRWHFAYRNWFSMPLMHSESASIHAKAMEEFGLYHKDVEYLATSQDGPESHELEKKARQVVQRDADSAREVGRNSMEFEKRHQVIIERFGRYPHRNKVLGREASQAEQEYLESGGETFSS